MDNKEKNEKIKEYLDSDKGREKIASAMSAVLRRKRDLYRMQQNLGFWSWEMVDDDGNPLFPNAKPWWE